MNDFPDPLADDGGAYLGSRRRFLVQAGCCLGAAVATLFAPPAVAAPWATDCAEALPPSAADMLARALDGLDAGQLWDMHCHLLGNGDSGSGCTLHPSLTSGFNLIERLRKRVILDAACVPADAPSIDRVYVDRLARLVAQFPAGARWLLFAFERAHDDNGRPDAAHTTIHVPDRYTAAVAAAQPGRFGWVASIHPYREDALDALAAAAQAGAVAVKWLPSSMNIDLRDPRSARLGERANAHGLPLAEHCGEEKAVPGARRDALVNPRHVRALLERGVRVIVAHCASLGHAADVDRPSAPEVPAFELFARLMEERAHGDRLLGDISAVFQVNRRPEVWHALLARRHWHPRLLHGSDYPLPGLKPLVSLGKLQGARVLSEADVPALAALREANPLLFDLALKRRLRRGGAALADAVFATRLHFERRAGTASSSN
ncbi:MAG: amidohydrolase family protein [Pseudomonadota bacterium]